MNLETEPVERFYPKSFVECLLEKAAAKLILNIGFLRSEKPAINTVAILIKEFLLRTGERISILTEHARRQNSNLLDVQTILNEIGFNFIQLAQFRQYCESKPELPVIKLHNGVLSHNITPKESSSIPFHTDLISSSSSFLYPALPSPQYNPTYPLSSSLNATISLIHPHPPNIPSHFPAFPGIHTYENTASYPKRLIDKQLINRVKRKTKQFVEEALKELTSLTDENVMFDDAFATSDDQELEEENYQYQLQNENRNLEQIQWNQNGISSTPNRSMSRSQSPIQQRSQSPIQHSASDEQDIVREDSDDAFNTNGNITEFENMNFDVEDVSNIDVNNIDINNMDASNIDSMVIDRESTP